MDRDADKKGDTFPTLRVPLCTGFFAPFFNAPFPAPAPSPATASAPGAAVDGPGVPVPALFVGPDAGAVAEVGEGWGGEPAAGGAAVGSGEMWLAAGLLSLSDKALGCL